MRFSPRLFFLGLMVLACVLAGSRGADQREKFSGPIVVRESLPALTSQLVAPHAMVGTAVQTDLKSFQKAAIAYALGKQQQSAFKLGPNESINYWDLQKKLSAPIEKRRKDYRDWLDKTNPFDDRKLWDEFIQKEDAAVYQLFRRHLANGEHCEARIYYGWIVNKPLEKQAAREVYAVYIRSYEAALEQLREFEKDQVAMTWACKSFDGKSTQALRLVSEGVRPQSQETARQLYADKDTSTTWPSFPTVALTFHLSDGTDGSWQNFVLYEIRHYDRTASDRLREGLDWMTGRWGGPYENLLQTKGLPAALDAFGANLEVEAEVGRIRFKDRATKVGFSLTRTPSGTVYMISRSHFLQRCTPVPERK